MSSPRRRFTASNLVPGRIYIVIKAFTDYDGIIHSISERWRFVEKNFLPYEDGLTLHVERNGHAETLRLQWREETQGQIIDDFSEHVEEV
jgi:hypothetical protein